MGKGKRTKQNSIDEQQRISQQAAQEKQETRNSRRTEYIAVGAVVLFFVICIAASVIYTSLDKSGWIARRTTVAKTADFKVDTVMAQYFFNTAVDNFTTENESYATQLGFDANADLKEQQIPYDGTDYETWYDYFHANTSAQITEYLTLCQAAKDEGITLEESDNAIIEKTLSAISTVAEENNMTVDEYITETYGEKVKKDDIRRCLELSQLASKYYSKHSADLKYSDSEIDSYYTENKADFLQCEYITYTFTASQSGTAKKIASAKSYTDFKTMFESFIEKQISSGEDAPTGDDLADAVEEALDDCVTTMSYDVSTDAGEWLFAEGRKTGDITLIKESGGYHLYYVTEPATQETYKTKNVRHILIGVTDDDTADKKRADTLLKEWRNGERTEESFALLATENTDDSGSVSTGGLYENVEKNQMVTEFNDWIFAAKRKVGDSEVVKSDYGYHIMYFVGDGVVAWKAPVISQMKEEDYNEKLSELEEKYSVTVSDKKLAKIKQIFDEDAASDTDSTAQ